MLEAVTELGCKYHSTGRPTYWSTDKNKIPDLLDFFISRKLPANYISIEEESDVYSDHSPIVLTLSDKIINKESNLRLINQRTDWDKFRREVNNRIKLKVPLKTINQLEQEAEKLITNLQQALLKSGEERVVLIIPKR